METLFLLPFSIQAANRFFPQVAAQIYGGCLFPNSYGADEVTESVFVARFFLLSLAISQLDIHRAHRGHRELAMG